MRGPGWPQKILSALLTLILVAVGARAVWELLQPLVAPAMGLLVLVGLWAWWRGRRDRW